MFQKYHISGIYARVILNLVLRDLYESKDIMLLNSLTYWGRLDKRKVFLVLDTFSRPRGASSYFLGDKIHNASRFRPLLLVQWELALKYSFKSFKKIFFFTKYLTTDDAFILLSSDRCNCGLFWKKKVFNGSQVCTREWWSISNSPMSFKALFALRVTWIRA